MILESMCGTVCEELFAFQIIDRTCEDGRYKGIVFGQKGNSRTGLSTKNVYAKTNLFSHRCFRSAERSYRRKTGLG